MVARRVFWMTPETCAPSVPATVVKAVPLPAPRWWMVMVPVPLPPMLALIVLGRAALPASQRRLRFWEVVAVMLLLLAALPIRTPPLSEPMSRSVLEMMMSG